MSKEIIKKGGREFEKETLPDGTVLVTLLPEKQESKKKNESVIENDKK